MTGDLMCGVWRYIVHVEVIVVLFFLVLFILLRFILYHGTILFLVVGITYDVIRTLK